MIALTSFLGYNLRPRVAGKSQTERTMHVLGEIAFSANPELDTTHFLFRSMDLSSYPEEYITRRFTRLPKKGADSQTPTLNPFLFSNMRCPANIVVKIRMASLRIMMGYLGNECSKFAPS